MPPLLRIRGLSIGVPGRQGELLAVRDVDLDVAAGEIVGLVGESGAGKSLTALSILGLVAAPARVVAGSIALGGRELRHLSGRSLRDVRGGRVGLVLQEPGAALNPVLPVGAQIIEAIRAHRDLSLHAARRRAVELLESLALPDAEARLASYPHQLSGGQQQRVLLAIALAADPELLVADEPTTALDVTVQADVLDLLDGLRRERGLGILLVTHDLGVVARICDRVIVLYAGQVVEQGPVTDVLQAPAHPYTRSLLASVPRLGEGRAARLPTIPGAAPALSARPPGCPFHPRCDVRRSGCERSEPAWVTLGNGRGGRCVLLASEALAG